MKQLILFIALVGLSHTLMALGVPQYPVSDIPESLFKNANAVVRSSKASYRIINTEQYVGNITEATTILNPKGTEQGFFSEIRDKFRRVENLVGTIYDAQGKVIRVLKKAEFEERVLNPDYGTSDNYRIIATPLHGVFPYTVVYSYTMTNKNPLGYPVFMPQSSSNVSVQNAQFTVVASNKNMFRYKILNSKVEPQIETNGEEQTFIWTFSKMPAAKLEPFSDISDYFPYILTAPNKFTLENYEGNFSSWKDFGLFYHHLNENRLDLPDATTTAVRNLAANATTTAEKVQLIYNYMQDKTRYISIQLGIGGWQCFAADEVDKNGYGDCKALSNYTKALLNAVGIKAHSALIYGGQDNRPVFADFASNRFNHVILCVPNNADTIWLECTSQTNPFNFMDDYTNNRYTLLIKSEGGELVRTPTSKASNNQKISAITVQLPNEGATLAIQSNIICLGEPAYELTQIHNFTDRKQQERWVQRQINPSDARIETFTIVPPEDRNKLNGSIKVTATLSRALIRAGNRLFVMPGVFSAFVEIPEATTDRKLPVFIEQPMLYADTIKIAIPANYAVETLPETVKIESVFGQCDINYQVNGQYLQCNYSLQINATKQAPNTYTDLTRFLTDVRKANNKQISFIKQ